MIRAFVAGFREGLRTKADRIRYETHGSRDAELANLFRQGADPAMITRYDQARRKTLAWKVQDIHLAWADLLDSWGQE